MFIANDVYLTLSNSLHAYVTPDPESKICRIGAVRGNKVPLEHGGVLLCSGEIKRPESFNPVALASILKRKIKHPGHNGHII
jgi:hypothetical protein